MCQLHRYMRQRGEAEWVIAPVRTVGATVGIATAGKEMRRIDREQVKPRGLRCHNACRTAEQIVQRGNHHAAFECVQNGRITRYH